jgi:hypothetical protein
MRPRHWRKDGCGLRIENWTRRDRKSISSGMSTNEIQKLMPGEFYPLDVEIWPTSIVVHPGYKLVLRIEGSDFQRMVPEGGSSVGMGGSGVFLHNDPMDSPIPEYAGTTTIATGKDRDSFLVLPLQPAR